MYVWNVTAAHHNQYWSSFFFVCFFLLLAQSLMEMLNKRTVPLAITKHLMIGSNLWAVAILFHSGRSRCSSCLSLTQKYLFSHRLHSQAIRLSVWPKPLTWTPFLSDNVKQLWKNCSDKTRVSTVYSQYLLWRFPERHEATQDKLGREKKDHQKKWHFPA